MILTVKSVCNSRSKSLLSAKFSNTFGVRDNLYRLNIFTPPFAKVNPAKLNFDHGRSLKFVSYANLSTIKVYEV